MTLTAFYLIALSVLMHVSWNLLSKASKPSAAFYIITSIAAVVFSLPFLWAANIRWCEIPVSFWWYFGFSCIANLLYYTGLFLSYKKSDISMAYPLVRALPVVLTAAVTVLLGIGKVPSAGALTGMFVVFCGCLLMPLKQWRDFKWRNYCTPVIGTICMAAAGTTGYTIFDSMAIPLFMPYASSSFTACAAFMAILEIVITVGLLPCLFIKEERKTFKELLRKPWAPLASGIFTVGAYVLVLLAMPQVTNVSFVQVFRQMGLPLGVIAGVFILKEKCSAPKLAGTVIIIAGLIAVAFC